MTNLIAQLADKHGLSIIVQSHEQSFDPAAPGATEKLNQMIKEIEMAAIVQYLKEFADELDKNCKYSNVREELDSSDYSTSTDFGIALAAQYTREKAEDLEALIAKDI